jgi:primosomal protein N' (replication factor Y)
VTLVGVINADTALNLPDFRAGERTFQLITQVAGRAGRGPKGGSVIVQTYNPGHYAIQAAKDHDYESFYGQEIKFRKELGYPPFCDLIGLTIAGREEKATEEAAIRIGQRLTGLEILGPAPAPISRLYGRFRWQILIKDDSINSAKKMLTPDFGQEEHGVKVTIDVDPINLL